MRPRRSALLTPTLALLVSLASGGRVAAFEWRAEHPRERGMDAARLEALRDDLSRRRTKALVVVRGDGVVLEWYADGHGPDRRHYTASLAKALVGGMSLALALDDGRLRLDDRASKHIAAWRDDPVRSRITVRQLATHSSGIEDASAPETGKSHNELEGWKGDFWRGRSIDPTPENVERMRDPFTIAVHRATAREPGVAFAYSNPGMAALSWAVTASLREGDAPPIDVRSLLRDRIMRPIGVDDRE